MNDSPESLSSLPFSLPEGSDNPTHIEPLHGSMRRDGPTIHSFYGQGFASDVLLAQDVGNVRITMANCETPEFGFDKRIVRVDLEKSSYAFAKVVDGLLLRGAEFAWHNCPRIFRRVFRNSVDYQYNVHEVDIYTPDRLPVIRGELGAGYSGDGSMQSQRDYPWTVVDLAAQRKQQADELAQQQAVAAQRTAWFQQRAAEEASAAATAKIVVRVILLLLVAGVLYWLREPIARWYYFAFHPHPAQSMVQAAIADGAPPLDGRALAAAVGELPPNNRILRKVRLEQGEQLVALMQESSRKRIREYELQAAHDYERAALAGIQEAIALAGVALERAKASFAASQRARG
ncbi:MAG TPA: hypothetical protein VGF97_18135 [Rhizomicrobium sp.]